MVIILLLSGCQFTRHGVKRVNPYENREGVGKNRTEQVRTDRAKNNSSSLGGSSPAQSGSPDASDLRNQEKGVWVKVLIYQGEKLSSDSNFSIKKDQVVYGGKRYQLKNGETTFQVKRDNPIMFRGDGFTGEMLVFKKKDIYVVNILPLEEYLLGVVRKEISYSWSEEAIKAQAIAARSYGYRKYLENYDKPYHLKGSTSDQAFAGTLDVHEKIIQGVRDTKGEIMVYNDYPILTFFHASCGGMTAKASEVWPTSEDLPYFQNIRCNFCTTHPRYEWTYQVDKTEVNRKLSQKLGQAVTSFYIKKLSSSKRVSEVVVSSSKGQKIITGNEFRLAIGARDLLSTKFKIRRSGGRYYINGNGYGHGVGLCQWGAKTMAERGYSAEKILNFYYHKIRFSSVDTIEKKLRSSLAKN